MSSENAQQSRFNLNINIPSVAFWYYFWLHIPNKVCSKKESRQPKKKLAIIFSPSYKAILLVVIFNILDKAVKSPLNTQKKMYYLKIKKDILGLTRHFNIMCASSPSSEILVHSFFVFKSKAINSIGCDLWCSGWSC